MKLINTQHSFISKIFLLSVCAVAFIFSSCTTVKKKVERTQIPPYQPSNVWTVGKLSYQFKRIAVLPIYYEDREVRSIDEFDQIFRAEISKQNSFEVRGLNREEMEYIFGKPHYSSVGTLPQDLLQKIYDEYGADGVLLVDLTEYNPYTPITMGVRSKLVHVKSAEVIWSFDNTFDAGNRAVQLAVEDFHNLENRNTRAGNVATGGILMSPRQFAKYVASATFKTIPKR
jgi:hypothetical protein